MKASVWLDPMDTGYYWKINYHSILDLGSSVCVLSKELYDLLDLDKKKWKMCDIGLLLVDDSTKHALGRINNIMIELHMKKKSGWFDSYGHGEKKL
jgi:hypothetical protein